MTGDDKKLGKKVTKTVVREYDTDGELIGETVTVETKKFKPEPERVVGFAKPFEAAK